MLLYLIIVQLLEYILYPLFIFGQFSSRIETRCWGTRWAATCRTLHKTNMYIYRWRHRTSACYAGHKIRCAGRLMWRRECCWDLRTHSL